jgi:hypothetical protein
MADFFRRHAIVADLRARRLAVAEGGVSGFLLRALWLFAMAVLAVAALLIVMVVFLAALVLTPVIFFTVAVIRRLARRRPPAGRGRIIEVDYERRD